MWCVQGMQAGDEVDEIPSCGVHRACRQVMRLMRFPHVVYDEVPSCGVCSACRQVMRFPHVVYDEVPSCGV